MSSSASTKRGSGKMNSDGKRRKKIAVDAPLAARFLTLEEQLIPGIPNEVTLTHITSRIPKPLQTFPILSALSPTWRQAMERGLVNSARVRLQSLETFIVLKQYDDGARLNAIDLFSMQTRNWHRLPSIPNVAGGLPLKCQCVGLAGTVYVLGGGKDYSDLSQDVYMWDLAGQGQWKQCAQMREGRQDFGCGVLNGKIYVFGGSNNKHEIIRGSEVYDPNQNAWSPIRPLRVKQFDHTVTTVGEVLYVYGGKYYKPYGNLLDAHGLKAYDPVHNRWRILLSGRSTWEYEVPGGFFVAQGKILSISLRQFRIDVYDRDSKLWTELHSFSLADIVKRHSTSRIQYRVGRIERVLLVDNELLVLVNGSIPNHDLLLHSRGFNSGHREISWEDVSRPLSSDSMIYDRVICSVQL